MGALRALAVLAREGWDPEQLAENFAGEVRQAFLLQVAPEVADAVDADRERLRKWGELLGLARSVRILETVGRTIREMKSAPDKIVMLEVAVVRLTKPELDHSFESLDERLTRLERGASRPSAPAPSAPALRPIASSVSAPRPAPPRAPAPSAANDAAAPEESVRLRRQPRRTADGSLALSLDDLRERFATRVVPRTSRAAQLLLRSARVESVEGLLLTIAVPSEEMRQNTELIAQGLKGALEHEFKVAFTLHWTVNPSLMAEPVPVRRAPKPGPDEEPNHGLERDDVAVVVDSAADHLITEMFPGAEEIS